MSLAHAHASSAAAVSNHYTERQTIGVFSQMIIFFSRSLVQQTRDLASLVLDFGLVFVGGFFLGLVFSDVTYQGPPPPGALEQCPVGLQQLLLSRPIYDPIPTEASLNCMTVALTAMSAALRVFGNEKTVFARETSAGMSPGAYFLGKNFAYLPHSFLAPFVFLIVFYTMVAPAGSIVKFFCILFLVDFTAVGASFLVSILAPAALSQLTGVLFVLMASMISGSFPTLVMLGNIVPPINILPAVSFLRWAQEAFYLAEISPWMDIFDTSPGLEQQGYKMNHMALDLGLLFTFGVVFRVLAFLTLLWRARSVS